jgi:hypothetical protein
LRHILGAAALALALAAAPAYGATFAQYKQTNDTDTVSFSGGNSLANVAGAVVEFDYTIPMPAGVDGPISAFLNINATGSPYDGSISFRRVSDNANLLTVAFTDAVLTGGGTAGVFFDSEPGVGTIVYTSDFLLFPNSTIESFSLSFSDLSNAFGGDSWTADSTGTFAVNTFERPGGVIPEPGTWAMMIVGFGGTGAILRRRRLVRFA